MIPKPIDQIIQRDLQDLIGKAEGRQLEFKQILGNSDEDIKEFLKDVSAMANSAGGDIIYGISQGTDESGNTVAKEVIGIKGENSDETILRLDNLLRDCIKPRLVGHRIQAINLSNSNTAFVIRVPQSWNSPHVVDRKNHWRFYYRDSAGAHQMDVPELRNAFLFSDTLAQRLEEFRLNRMAKISANPLFDKASKIILHLQPIASAQPDFVVDIAKLERDPKKLALLPFPGFESALRFNFDGLLATSRHANQNHYGYVQVFRNGTVEFVDTYFLNRDDDLRRIKIRTVEERLINAVIRGLAIIRDLSIVSPVLVHLSLLDVKGYKFALEPGGQWGLSHYIDIAEENEIDEKDLLLPGILILEENLADFGNLTIPDRLNFFNDERFKKLFRQTSTLFQPIFNIIWNAAGFHGSIYYNSEGIWDGDVRY